MIWWRILSLPHYWLCLTVSQSEEELLRMAIEASLKESAPRVQPNPEDDDLKKALELSLKEYQAKMGV